MRSSPVPIAVVLAGGLALGSYQVGVVEALSNEESFDIVSVAGTSIGAFNAALIAGNAQEDRVERLRTFWRRLAKKQPLMDANPWLSGHARSWTAAMRARMEGVGALFHPYLRLSEGMGGPGLYDALASEGTLTELVEFDLLNKGDIRCCIGATDLQTSEAVFFDTAAGDIITPAHIRASGSLIPTFPPTKIGQRWLVDGGLAANAPLEPVLSTAAPSAPPAIVVMVDLFPSHGPYPANLERSNERSTDIMYSAQTDMRLKALQRERELLAQLRPETAGVDVMVVRYAGGPDEAGAEKTFDFSEASLERRRAAGRAAGQRVVDSVAELNGSQTVGLRINRI
ncbi:patatin-like phospholipase family protein [Xanthobacteraceae bacterium A53D]